MKETLFLVLLFCAVALILNVAKGQNNSSSSRLRIAIPVRDFDDFVSVKRDSLTGEQNYSGFAIEVFKTVMNTALPSLVPFDFIPFAKPDGTMNGTFDDMLKAVFSQEYDGAVGEISILYYRTNWVDFTMPYLASSISMLVPINRQQTISKGAISLNVVNVAITAFTLALSFIIAVAYWIAEFRNYKKTSQQIAANSSSLPTQNHDEWQREIMGSMTQMKLQNIVFFTLLIILIACYISSQTSPLPSQRQDSGAENFNQLIRTQANVGYRKGSFIRNLLVQKSFPESKLISLNSEDEMVEMLSKGTAQGGVDAIVADTPNLRLLQAKHCDAFTIVPTVNLPAAGFGFAFRKGSSLGSDVSKGILKILDNGRLATIQDRTIGSLSTCQDYTDTSSTIKVPKNLWISTVVVFIALFMVFVLYSIVGCVKKNKVK